MPRLRTLLLAGSAIVFIQGPAASSAQELPRLESAPKRLVCPPASPIAASRAVVAFTTRWNLYACRRGRAAGRPRLLQYGGGPMSLDGRWDHVDVEGGVVAWSYTSPGPRCGGIYVSAADVRRGVNLWGTSAGSFAYESEANGCFSYGARVQSLDVEADGSAVFVAGDPGDYEVTVVHARKARPVARGADVDPTSATIYDATARWYQAGEWRTAPVVAPPAQTAAP